MVSEADKLEGLVLNERWTVEEKLTFHGGSGGNFSVGYKVHDEEGNEAFLKAIDLSLAADQPDPTRFLNILTNSFIFERNLVLECKEKNLSRIVRAIDDGTYTPPHQTPYFVPFLIFEMADDSVRSQANSAFDLAFSLRCLHETTVGLRQLHSIDTAHQDLKPSNILLFENVGAKLSDLGSSVKKGEKTPQSEWFFSGDPGYWPPEVVCGYKSEDWELRRKGADFYQLGSMVYFFFSGVSMTTDLKATLDPKVHSLDYHDALPFYKSALSKILGDLKIKCGDRMCKEIKDIISYLCEPNYKFRGHPKWLTRNQFSLEPIISRFDYLAKHAEAGFIEILKR